MARRNKKVKLKLFNEFATREKLEFINTLMSVVPDPDEILADNNYDWNIYRDLLSDPHLTATMQQRKQQVLQMDYELICCERNSNQKNSDEYNKEAELVIENLPMSKIMSEILDCIFFGFTAQEIFWKINESDKIVPYDVVAKPQEYFIFDTKGKIKMRKRSEGTYLYEEGINLPHLKFLINLYHPTFRNPYGEKILQRCYWSVTFKRAAIEFWQLMVEKYGMPFLTGYYPSAYTQTQQDAFEEALTDMITDNVAIFDEALEDKIKLLESPSYDIGQLYQFLVEFHNNEISKAVLTVTLTTDIKRTGSYKAGEIHKEMLAYIGLADKKIVENAVTELLQMWSLVNYGHINSPKFYLKRKETIIDESDERDISLTKMGIKFTKEYFMKRYNLQNDDFDLVDSAVGLVNQNVLSSNPDNTDGGTSKNLVLAPSRKNPSVLRWQKIQTQQTSESNENNNFNLFTRFINWFRKNK